MPTEISGKQIRDGTIEGVDVKNGSLTFEDFDTSSITWKAPVANESSLPTTGNSSGDARVALTESSLNIWDGNTWKTFATSSYSTADFNTDFATKDTDNLAEGVVNKYFHTHEHDDRYYTESEADTLLSNKSNTSHLHDDRYYTETEADNILSGKSDTGHTHDNTTLTSIDWSKIANKPDPVITLSGGVTGSATMTSVGSATITATVADDSHTHDGRYYTESEADAKYVYKSGDTITGDLIVSGNLTINGTTTSVDTTNLLIEDNIIILNKNQTGTPAGSLTSGIEIERGDSTNYQFMFRESDDAFVIGAADSLQTVATRQDTPTANAIPYWNSTAYRLDSSGVTVSGSTLTGSLSGNASSATKLASSVNIQGVAFDGSTEINPINGTGFVKSTGAILSYDNTSYLSLAGGTLTGQTTMSNVYFVIDKDKGILGDGLNAGARNYIWGASSSYPDYGLSYYEGSPDYFAFSPNGTPATPSCTIDGNGKVTATTFTGTNVVIGSCTLQYNATDTALNFIFS